MPEKLKEPEFIIVILVILLAFTVDMVAYFFKTQLDHDLVVQILTTFNGGGFIASVQYAIGSSSGSKDKDAAIASLANGKKP